MTWLEDMYLGSPALAEVETGSAFDFSPGNNHTACSAPCLPLNYSPSLLSGPVYPECSESRRDTLGDPFPSFNPSPPSTCACSDGSARQRGAVLLRHLFVAQAAFGHVTASPSAVEVAWARAWAQHPLRHVCTRGSNKQAVSAAPCNSFQFSPGAAALCSTCFCCAFFCIASSVFGWPGYSAAAFLVAHNIPWQLLQEGIRN